MAQHNIYDMLNENIEKMIEPLPTEVLLKKISRIQRFIS